MKTQICIVTEQVLANLIAILHFKPKKIFMVATNSMKGKSKELKKILADLGIAETVFTLDGCPDTDLKEINQFLTTKLAEKLPQEPCVFNLTGGTKLHSFSMYEVFKHREYQDQFIYVDTRNKILEYYPNKESESFNESLPVVLNANMTLKGMGKENLGAGSDDNDWQEDVIACKDLTYWIANNIVKIKDLLKVLNGIVAKLYPDEQSFMQSKTEFLNDNPRGKWRELLSMANDFGCITWNGNTKITFDNYEQARYLTGNWIEEYVWLIARDMGFDEVHCSLKFGNETNNEIDVFIQHHNLSLAIECKSASRVEQNMCHKLNSIAHRAGGLMCSKLFISAFPLDKDNENDMNLIFHAREQYIKIVQAEEIVSKLPEILNKWKESGRL